MHSMRMQPTALESIAESAHDREPCKNGWTDRDAIWVWTQKKKYRDMPRGWYTQRDMQGGSTQQYSPLATIRMATCTERCAHNIWVLLHGHFYTKVLSAVYEHWAVRTSKQAWSVHCRVIADAHQFTATIPQLCLLACSHNWWGGLIFTITATAANTTTGWVGHSRIWCRQQWWLTGTTIAIHCKQLFHWHFTLLTSPAHPQSAVTFIDVTCVDYTEW